MRAYQAAVVEGPGPEDVAFGPAGSGLRPFVFDRRSRLLWREGAEVPLPPRVLGVLDLLLERRGQLVQKQELISSVWRDAYVTETSLAEAVSVLRQALGDDRQQPTFVQTLHRRGGTSNAAAPFFSPDGRSLGFFTGGTLMTMSLAGGSPVEIAAVSGVAGATWLNDGRIVFSRGPSEGLHVAQHPAV